MALEFPFETVDEIDLEWPAIPNYEAVIAAIPDNFPAEDDALFMCASERFALDDNDPSFMIALRDYVFKDSEAAQDQMRYLTVWARSFQPSHQDKERVLAWLFSLALQKAD